MSTLPNPSSHGDASTSALTEANTTALAEAIDCLQGLLEFPGSEEDPKAPGMHDWCLRDKYDDACALRVEVVGFLGKRARDNGDDDQEYRRVWRWLLYETDGVLGTGWARGECWAVEQFLGERWDVVEEMTREAENELEKIAEVGDVSVETGMEGCQEEGKDAGGNGVDA